MRVATCEFCPHLPLSVACADVVISTRGVVGCGVLDASRIYTCSFTPDDDDPPWWQVLCVQRKFSSEAPTQHYRQHCSFFTPGSFGRMPFNGRWTIDSFVGRGTPCGTRRATIHQSFDPLPAYFVVRLLSSLSAPRVSTSRSHFTETPLIEVLSAEVRPRHFALHQHLAL